MNNYSNLANTILHFNLTDSWTQTHKLIHLYVIIQKDILKTRHYITDHGKYTEIMDDGVTQEG